MATAAAQVINPEERLEVFADSPVVGDAHFSSSTLWASQLHRELKQLYAGM
jgi:hypothetical protein